MESPHPLLSTRHMGWGLPDGPSPLSCKLVMGPGLAACGLLARTPDPEGPPVSRGLCDADVDGGPRAAWELVYHPPPRICWLEF